MVCGQLSLALSLSLIGNGYHLVYKQNALSREKFVVCNSGNCVVAISLSSRALAEDVVIQSHSHALVSPLTGFVWLFSYRAEVGCLFTPLL